MRHFISFFFPPPFTGSPLPHLLLSSLLEFCPPICLHCLFLFARMSSFSTIFVSIFLHFSPFISSIFLHSSPPNSHFSIFTPKIISIPPNANHYLLIAGQFSRSRLELPTTPPLRRGAKSIPFLISVGILLTRDFLVHVCRACSKPVVDG